MTTASHTPGPWDADGVTTLYAAPGEADTMQMIEIRANVSDDGWNTVAFLEATCAGAAENARLIATAPRLLKTLEMSEHAIEEATDIMHYDDGLPATALDGWEIERAYVALCSVLVEMHQAIATAKGEKA